MDCLEATVFSPEVLPSESPNELDSDAFTVTHRHPIERFNVSNLDSSTEDSMDQDQAEPWSVSTAYIYLKFVLSDNK